MLDRLTGWSTRHRLIVVVAALLFVVSLLVLLYLAGNPSRDGRTVMRGPAPIPSRSPSASRTTTAQPSASPALSALSRTDDPVAYAREVAAALFDVNPAVVSRAEFLDFWRGELPTVVYSDGAAKGLTLHVQNVDAIDNLTSSWIPPESVWETDAAEHTTSQFQITSVSVPDYWVEAVAQGTFRDPGLHMERVMGVLTQTYGTDTAHRQASARSIVIDLGLLCRPTEPGGCRLLAPQPPPGGDISQ
jgi:hypothetical protein